MIYTVTRKSDGVEITRYASSAAVEVLNGEPFPFTDFDHIELVVGAAPTTAVDPARWRIWVGSFFDRFGAYKIPILADVDPVVQAIVKDATVRRYIDLIERRAELLQAITLLQSKGHAVDAAVILDLEPTEAEVWNG